VTRSESIERLRTPKNSTVYLRQLTAKETEPGEKRRSERRQVRDFGRRSLGCPPLQVGKPPEVAATPLEARVLTADRVGNGNHGEPDEIDPRKAEAVVGREELRRASHRGWRKQEKPARTITQSSERHRKKMRDSQMEKEKEERNAAENNERVGGREIYALERARVMSAGPTVIRRKRREGGFLVVLRKESAVKSGALPVDQRAGSP